MTKCHVNRITRYARHSCKQGVLGTKSFGALYCIDKLLGSVRTFVLLLRLLSDGNKNGFTFIPIFSHNCCSDESEIMRKKVSMSREKSTTCLGRRNFQ